MSVSISARHSLVFVACFAFSLAALFVAVYKCEVWGCAYAFSDPPLASVRSPPSSSSSSSTPAVSRPRVHLVTFATPEYENAAKKLMYSALNVAKLDVLERYTLDSLDDDFRRRNAEILAARRGAGYWIWKPYVVLKHLVERAEFGDVVVYCDSLYDFKTELPLEEWFENDPDVVAFEYKPHSSRKASDLASVTEKRLSKRDAFYLMNVDYSVDFHQNWAGFAAFRKSFRSIRFVSEWLTYVQDPRIVTDSPSSLPNDPGFHDNRHDQTVFSLLLRKWNVTALSPPDRELRNVKNEHVPEVFLRDGRR